MPNSRTPRARWQQAAHQVWLIRHELLRVEEILAFADLSWWARLRWRVYFAKLRVMERLGQWIVEVCMSLVAINPDETYPYISKFDPDHPDQAGANPEQATVFHLKVVTAIFMERFRARQPSTMKLNTRRPDDMAEINITPVTDVDMVRIGVADIDRFYDRHQQLVRVELTRKHLKGIEYEVLPDYIIDMLHPQVVAELAAEIRRINELQEPEVTNSDSRSSSALSAPSIDAEC